MFHGANDLLHVFLYQLRFFSFFSPLLLMAEGAPPKMPRFMLDVIRQVYNHPNYQNLSKADQFGFDVAAQGYSWRNNNAFMRRYWKHLYWGESLEKPPKTQKEVIDLTKEEDDPPRKQPRKDIYPCTTGLSNIKRG